ncbi:MAG: hypothetical protein AAGE94_09775 [Acidobacteriota bacterium]
MKAEGQAAFAARFAWGVFEEIVPEEHRRVVLLGAALGVLAALVALAISRD